VLGQDGKSIPINADKMGPGFVAEPEKFQCKFVPRTVEIAKSIQKKWLDASKLLDEEQNYSEDFYQVTFGEKRY